MRSMFRERKVAGACSPQSRNVARQHKLYRVHYPAFAGAVWSRNSETATIHHQLEIANPAELVNFYGFNPNHGNFSFASCSENIFIKSVAFGFLVPANRSRTVFTCISENSPVFA